jgi:hypothetical protein
MAQFGFGHASVQGQSGDEVHVVHAGGGGEVEDRFDDALAHIGSTHGREGQADVVEADRELHAGREKRPQRRRIAQRIVERQPDGGIGIIEGFKRLAGIEYPAAAGGQSFEAKGLAVVKEDGWRGAVYV